MRDQSLTGLALAVLSLFVLAAAAAAKDQVPLRGSLSGDVAITPLTPPFVQVAIEGSGKPSHLDALTVSIPPTVNRADRTALSTYLFTAANRDTLTATFTGQPAPTADPAVLAIVEIATITGGTGRSANASGEFVTELLLETVAGTTVRTARCVGPPKEGLS
jgi:hypothetical protein